MLSGMFVRGNRHFFSVNNHLQVSRMILGATTPGMPFSTPFEDCDNYKMMPEGMLEKEKKLFQERVSDKEKKVMEA